MQQIAIKNMEASHMPEVVSILNDTISTYSPDSKNYDNIWKEFSKQSNIFAFVAIYHNQVVGYGSILLETKIRGGKMGHIEDIAVVPNMQGRGVGSILLKHLHSVATKHGCYKVALQCKPHNEEFYIKNNYSKNGYGMQLFFD